MTRARDLADQANGIVNDAQGNVRSGRKNLIINGNFDVWQRGTSTSTDNVYLADRWFTANGTGGGEARTVSRQAFTIGQTDVPNNPTYFMRHDQTGGAPSANSGIAQKIESVYTAAGQTITVSVWLKAAANLTVLPRIVQNFGTTGSPSSSVVTNASTIAVTTAWQKFEIPIDVPSISGKTLGTDGNDFLQFELQPATTATFTLDVAQVQLEAGSVATDFEHRSYGEELALCQRYLPRWSGLYGASWMGQARSSTNVQVNIPFNVPVRAVPTGITFSDLNHFNVLDASGAAQKPTAVTFNVGSTSGLVQVNFTMNTGTFASGNAVLITLSDPSAWFQAEGTEL